jgi:hypothetical protein
LDSLTKLKLICQKYSDSDAIDNDAKIEMTSFEIKHWCNDYLKIHQNIEETSISNAHRIERKEKLINQILNK